MIIIGITAAEKIVVNPIIEYQAATPAINNDVTNEIRRGSMTRNQALNIAKKFDGEPPDSGHIKKYLEYYSMNGDEFNEIIDKWANKDLFYKNNQNIWTPKFEIY